MDEHVVRLTAGQMARIIKMQDERIANLERELQIANMLCDVYRRKSEEGGEEAAEEE